MLKPHTLRGLQGNGPRTRWQAQGQRTVLRKPKDRRSSPKKQGPRQGSQAARRPIYERLRENHGDLPIDMPPKFITMTLQRMTPAAARNWYKALHGLFTYAVEVGMLSASPTASVKPPKVKSKPHRPWTDVEIAAYESAHPIGSTARLALALGLYTGQRRSDVVRMGRQHIRDGVLSIGQQKTGAAVDVPVIDKLRTIIEATPSDHLTFLTKKSGEPYSGTSFNYAFRQWCNQAALPADVEFHGLRYSAAKMLTDAGCTPFEVASITGHKSLNLVQKYTRDFERKRLAKSAMAKLVKNI